MKNHVRSRFSIGKAMVVAAQICVGAGLMAAPEPTTANVEWPAGLVVRLGAGEAEKAGDLSLTGRFLIHFLDPRERKIAAAQHALRQEGRYGLVWAEQRDDLTRLPYAENVVNALVIQENFGTPPQELARILVPGGHLICRSGAGYGVQELEEAGFEQVEESESGLRARKSWPEAMDAWSHPRHGPGGNAVSQDTTVGPPQRVRWVAAATWEVEGLVSAGGRNFYGGILARDSFNGLRLWHRDLAGGGEADAASFKLPRLPREGARPVAGERFLYAIVKGKVVALDAATGQTHHEFSGVEQPRTLLNDGSIVVAAGFQGVHGFEAATGKPRWHFEAAEPHNVVAANGLVSFLHGRPKRGEKTEAVTVSAEDGSIRWRTSDFPWLDRTTRTVLYGSHLAFEVSTFNDHDAGNAVYVVDANTGTFAWEKAYPPGMNHVRQARALFLEDAMWILHGGKINTATPDQKGRLPVEVSALELGSGEVLVTHKAGLAHCFPPVATPNYMFAGELDLTDLRTGDVKANRITKANCSRENGWVPANGLVYTTPKHCTCWPMLRGFVAMAPALEGANPSLKPLNEIDFPLEVGPADPPDGSAPRAQAADWPSYRADVWRSGSSSQPGPANLKVAWKVSLIPPAEKAALEGPPAGPILHDWRENPYIKGPLTAPIVVGETAYLARPDAHEVLAVATDGTGTVRWRFTANGRVDTAPTYHQGLLLFGTHAGSVYALRADSGEQVWRLRAAPTEDRIVAYGQLESPWPVPGSILVDEDIAYFVAGRQELADGGVLVFAVDPRTGSRHWVHRVDEVPQTGFYENSGLEFDPVDLPHREGDQIAMSRWIISRDGKERSVDKWNAFARLDVAGEGAAWVPRGFWTYGARHQYRFAGEAPKRPLCVYRGGLVIGQLNGSTDIFRRQFDLENGETFESQWITGWKASKTAREGGKPYRSYRIAEKASWVVDPFTPEAEKKEVPPGTQVWNDVYGMALGGSGRVYLAHKDGRVVSLQETDGTVIEEGSMPSPVWDSLIVASGRLFATTMQGELVCLGQ